MNREANRWAPWAGAARGGPPPGQRPHHTTPQPFFGARAGAGLTQSMASMPKRRNRPAPKSAPFI